MNNLNCTFFSQCTWGTFVPVLHDMFEEQEVVLRLLCLVLATFMSCSRPAVAGMLQATGKHATCHLLLPVAGPKDNAKYVA